MGKVPTGVKVISVLYYIGAVLGVLFGLLFMLGGGAMGSMMGEMPLLGALGAGLFVVGGLAMIAFGVLGFFVGKGLWNGKSWARIVALIFASLGLLMALLGIVQGQVSGNLFGLVLNGLIGGYLLLSKEVKSAFR